MMPIENVMNWLSLLERGNQLAVDDGGLCLVELTPEGAETGCYCEIGGIPILDKSEISNYDEPERTQP